MRTSRSRGKARRSACPIAAALDVLGDRWTLLLIRDLLHGKTRYSEFLEGQEGIPTNILAERLARLQENGIIVSKRYQSHPPRYSYTLTRRGADLKPVVRSLALWGLRHRPGTDADKELAAILRRA